MQHVTAVFPLRCHNFPEAWQRKTILQFLYCESQLFTEYRVTVLLLVTICEICLSNRRDTCFTCATRKSTAFLCYKKEDRFYVSCKKDKHFFCYHKKEDTLSMQTLHLPRYKLSRKGNTKLQGWPFQRLQQVQQHCSYRCGVLNAFVLHFNIQTLPGALTSTFKEPLHSLTARAKYSTYSKGITLISCTFNLHIIINLVHRLLLHGWWLQCAKT